ncbi:hypothetical protein T492DRAFT_306517 [Pavlovales sp. CCMP2436]|nr:hypothetical protein T492DRAFT_306517 [Pavlovales sp. CCMP2436]
MMNSDNLAGDALMGQNGGGADASNPMMAQMQAQMAQVQAQMAEVQAQMAQMQQMMMLQMAATMNLMMMGQNGGGADASNPMVAQMQAQMAQMQQTMLSQMMNPMGGMAQNGGGADASNPMVAQMQAQMAQMQQMMAANNQMVGLDSQANGDGTRRAVPGNEGRAPATMHPRDGSDSDPASAQAGRVRAQSRRVRARSAARTPTSGVNAALLPILGTSQQHVQAVPPPPVQVAGGEYLCPAEPPNHAVAADPLALDFAAALGEDEPMPEAGKAGGDEGETPPPPDSPRRAVVTEAAADAADRAAGSGVALASHTSAIAAAKEGARPAPLAAISVGAGKAGVGPTGGERFCCCCLSYPLSPHQIRSGPHGR